MQRVETLPTTTVPEESPSTDTSLRTRTSSSSTSEKAFCPWLVYHCFICVTSPECSLNASIHPRFLATRPTPVQVPTVLNFSFAPQRLLGWTVRVVVFLLRHSGLISFSFASAGKHVVFGSVVEGYNVIKTIESYGSQSGATKAKIVIADCGEIA
ncbi:hypothetical protein BC830DRAFT_177730 [Chytriomyces sp. MP71]|nr:hypothetical protein BC830DRAFT_177730 [Chytriomyces sp. MP71]